MLFVLGTVSAVLGAPVIDRCRKMARNTALDQRRSGIDIVLERRADEIEKGAVLRTFLVQIGFAALLDQFCSQYPVAYRAGGKCSGEIAVGAKGVFVLLIRIIHGTGDRRVAGTRPQGHPR
jgi:hypothetical protein